MSSDEVAAASVSVESVERANSVVDSAADQSEAPKLYQCSSCSRIYTTAFNLRRHVRKTHSAPVDKEPRLKKKAHQKHESLEVPVLTEKEFEGVAIFQIVIRGNLPTDSTVSVHRLF